MNTFEISIIRSHAIILQILYDVHAFLRHILLSKYLCKLFCTVVTEVDKDNNIALLNSSVNSWVVYSLDKLVGNAVGITLLHSLYHVGSLFSLTFNKQVVSLFYTIPSLVTVHSIKTSNNTCYACTIFFTYLFNISDKALAALRISITAIHETVYENFLQVIFLTYLYKFIHMIHWWVHTAGRCQPHDMQFLTGFLCITVSFDNILVL